MRVSYSKIGRFEQCPLAYRYHYIDRLKNERGTALLFGSAIHDVLERLVKYHKDNNETCMPDLDRALSLWDDTFSESSLSGSKIYQEGVDILTDWCKSYGFVNWSRVLDVEREFAMRLGTFEVIGYIDRIDKVNDTTVGVVDYKTNRRLFTRDDLDNSLQLTIYALAVKEIYPWAKTVRLKFDMLRHGVSQYTDRDERQLEAAKRYIVNIAKRISDLKSDPDSVWPATINTNCNWCDHRKNCTAYAEALTGEQIFRASDESYEEICKERETLGAQIKILKSRKSEIDDILKATLEKTDKIVAAGHRYKYNTSTRVSYPVKESLEVICDALNIDAATAARKICSIDKRKMIQLIEVAFSDDEELQREMFARLDHHSKRNATPRFSSAKVNK